jgi:hypothetical protein
VLRNVDRLLADVASRELAGQLEANSPFLFLYVSLNAASTLPVVVGSRLEAGSLACL